LGRSFVFSSANLVRLHARSSNFITIYTSSSDIINCFAAVGKRASKLYVAQRPWAEALPKLMGHHQSPALGAHYFGNAQALGHKKKKKPYTFF
jgi:hypothetical protein